MDVGAILRTLRHNGQPYAGVNVLVLWMSAVESGYMSPHWMTLSYVRKGEHGSMVVYADCMTRVEHTDKGEDVERQIPFLKAYTRVQRGADCKPARALLREAGTEAPGAGAHRVRRTVLRRDECRDPPRRCARLLFAEAPFHQHAALRQIL